MLRKFLIVGLLAVGARGSTGVPSLTQHGINMQDKHIYNYGFIDLTTQTNDFTDAYIGRAVVSSGQLCGINPVTGEIITNEVNLLPIMVRSAYIAGAVDAGRFVGDGAGLTNLTATALVGYIPVASLPTSGVWNISDLTLQNANFEGPVSVGGPSLDVESDLNVQGQLCGDASGLSNVPAGGADGSLQFNDAGRLMGNTNYFIHAETGKMAFQSNEGNLWRAYKWGTVNQENLIYRVRRYEDTTELALYDDGVEKIRLRGDGSAYIAGSLEVDGEVILANGATIGGDSWYVPESGDLSMGDFVEGGGLSVAASQYIPDSTDLSMGSYAHQ